MAKYSYEFKKMIVDAYLNGEGGYKHLSSVYGPTRRDIQKWVNRFRAAGPDALRPHKKGRKKILDKECLFKRTEETAFRGRSKNERTAKIISSLRRQFKLKDLPKHSERSLSHRLHRQTENIPHLPPSLPAESDLTSPLRRTV